MKTYLRLYNLSLATGWALLLILYIINGCELNYTGLVLLNICQFAAVIEIINAALKIVSSPVFTTIKQLGSRFMVVILIDLLQKEEYISYGGITGLYLIMFAWGITEVVRYSYYYRQQATDIGHQTSDSLLTFLRYTLFLVLYPAGVAGELLIILTWMKRDGFSWSLNDVVFGIIILSYFIFFPGMYGYMLAQRKKKL